MLTKLSLHNNNSIAFFTVTGSDITIEDGTDMFRITQQNVSKCFVVNLTVDGQVEGNDTVSLFLEEVTTSSSRGIRLVEPNATTITIVDIDSE